MTTAAAVTLIFYFIENLLASRFASRCKLRGFVLVGNDLYIASAWRKDSHFAGYRRQSGFLHFEEVLAKTKQESVRGRNLGVRLDHRRWTDYAATGKDLARVLIADKPSGTRKMASNRRWKRASGCSRQLTAIGQSRTIEWACPEQMFDVGGRSDSWQS